MQNGQGLSAKRPGTPEPRRIDISLIRMRVHDEYGVAVRLPGVDSWQRASPIGGPLTGLVIDEYVSGPGWRELDVSERH